MECAGELWQRGLSPLRVQLWDRCECVLRRVLLKSS